MYIMWIQMKFDTVSMMKSQTRMAFRLFGEVSMASHMHLHYRATTFLKGADNFLKLYLVWFHDNLVIPNFWIEFGA